MGSPSKSDLSADVVVIGGGPGGSTAATMLARQGLQVLLLEREHFPRDHIGESLLPASMPVLEELGVLPRIEEAEFLPKWGATMVWGKGKSPWSWYFRETNQRHPHSYQVWRPQFDQLLLENSRACGVAVREGHRVVDVLFEGGRATGVRYSADSSVSPLGKGGLRGVRGQATVRANFVVDASGQSALLGRKLRLRRWDSFFQNLAVYGYFTGAQRLPEPDVTNIFIESYADGWFWNIPLHTGWTSVGAVVDARSAQEGLREAGAQAYLMEQIGRAPYTRQMLGNARLEHGPFVIKDWSYISDEVVGDGYVLVGDAACFVDPLFSSGVHLALMSGVLAAAYVVSALKDEDIRDAAGQAYKELYYKEYGHFREMAKLFYSSNRTVDSYFWEARRLLGADGDPSPRKAFIRAVAGQPPRGYERVVLERGEAPAEFVRNVSLVESERQARRANLEAAQHPPQSPLSKGGSRGVEQTSLYRAVPRLAAGVQVRRKPVLAAGEFVWGDVLTTAGYPEGLACSGMVAELVSMIDGRASVAELLSRLSADRGEPGATQIQGSAMEALGILYVDGAIEELQGL